MSTSHQNMEVTLGSTLTVDSLDTLAALSDERLSWIRKQLAAISYKPGWTFTLDTDTYVGPAVVIEFTAEDTHNPGTPITLTSVNLVIDAPTDPQLFGRWLLAVVAAAEMHEASESFKMNGALVMDPHDAHNRVWTVALTDAINAAARSGADAFFAVLHAAVAPAVTAGTVPPEPTLKTCRDHLQRNVPLKANS